MPYIYDAQATLLTAREAAELAEVSERTIRRWARAGKVSYTEQPYPGGTRLLVAVADLTALLKARGS